MCKAIRYILPDNHILQINSDIVTKLFIYKQISHNSTEAGGVVLGRVLKESYHLVIDEISVPFSDDIRKKNYFKRNKEKHQRVIYDRWLASNKTENYFGEWHTHAEDYPNPSFIDKNDWKRRIRNDKLILDYLISIIVGRKSIDIWLIYKNGKIIKLERNDV